MYVFREIKGFQNSNANPRWFCLHCALLTNFNEFSSTYFWLIWNMTINKNMQAWRNVLIQLNSQIYWTELEYLDFAKWMFSIMNMLNNTESKIMLQQSLKKLKACKYPFFSYLKDTSVKLFFPYYLLRHLAKN